MNNACFKYLNLPRKAKCRIVLVFLFVLRDMKAAFAKSACLFYVTTAPPELNVANGSRKQQKMNTTWV